MPDVFVPQDTAGISDFLSEVTKKGLVYKFCFDFADKNREQLSQFKNLNAFTDYLEKQNILHQFVKYARKKGVNKNTPAIEKSEKILETQLKAYIARNILDEKSFYLIINDIDNTLKEAIEVLTKKQG